MPGKPGMHHALSEPRFDRRKGEPVARCAICELPASPQMPVYVWMVAYIREHYEVPFHHVCLVRWRMPVPGDADPLTVHEDAAA